MEGLFVDRVDGETRREDGRIVQRPHLDDDGGKTGRSRDDMRAAFRAELARDGTLEVAPRELRWLARGVFEAIRRHRNEHVWRTAGDVLAFATMALRLHHRIAFRRIAQRTTIASTFELHRVSSI